MWDNANSWQSIYISENRALILSIPNANHSKIRDEHINIGNADQENEYCKVNNSSCCKKGMANIISHQ